MNNETLIMLEDKIEQLSSTTCDTCRGDIENGECIFCCNKNMVYLQLLDEINKNIMIFNDITYKELPYLLGLSSLNKESTINDFLNKHEIYNKINIMSNNIKSKLVNNDILDQEEQKFLENYFKFNLSLKEQDAILNILVIKNFYDKNLVSAVTFKNLLQKTMLNEMKKIFISSKISIKEEANNVLGKLIHTNISINEEGFNKFYNEDGNNTKSDKIEFFNTFYHEFTHLLQKYRIQKQINEIDKIIISEEKLKKMDPNFYKENYNNLMMEKEANLMGKIYSLYYYHSLELIKIEDDFNLFNINTEEYLLKNENYERIIFGKNQNIFEYLDNKTPIPQR